MKRLIFIVSMLKSKRFLKQKYSAEWYKKFRTLSKKHYAEINAQIPNIGKSIFSMNYNFAPSYIAWYKAFSELSIAKDEIDRNIWGMNERMMTIIPKFMLRTVGKIYLTGFRRNAKKHIKRQNTVGVHPYDWEIEYHDIDDNCFEIDIKSCAFVKLTKELGAEGLLPGACRMDYLSAYLMGNGFERTKTLGDGDDCCNCRYYIKGDCEWSPEKAFTDRK